MRKKDNALILFYIGLMVLIGCNDLALDAAQETVRGAAELDCLYYLSRIADGEGIYRQCRGSDPEVVIKGVGVFGYALAQESDMLVYIRESSDGMLDIWASNQDGEEQEKIYSCGDSAYENLTVSPNGNVVYFSRAGQTPALIRLELEQGKEIIVINSIVNFIDISPDGEFLRFHDEKTNLLRVVSTVDLELALAFPVDVDLIGGWSPDSQHFLAGERNADSNLMVNAYQEISVTDRQSDDLFNLPAETEYYQPFYSGNDTFYALTRNGLRSNTRQVIEINRQGERVGAITDSPSFDHFALNLSRVSGSIAFQRYDLTSTNSTPEVMVWDQQTGSLALIAEDAVQPRWLD